MFRKKIKGFTVIELLIVMAISVVLFGVVLFNYGTFNDKASLSSSAQEVAVGIRQAQIYGINVKEATVGGGNFNNSYGVYFNRISSPDAYYIFVDKNNNGVYSDPIGACGGTECIEKILLKNGVTVHSITSTSCSGASSIIGVQVFFKRPNPDAIIKLMDYDGYWCNSQVITNATITLKSPKGEFQTINIENTGQIYLP